MHYLQALFGLENKVAVVIGGGGVLAGCMAEGLAKAGAHIAILDVNIDNAQKQSEIIKKYGVRVSAIQTDASKKEDLLCAEKDIIAQYGRVDILINAPGINSSTPFLDIQEEEWERILDVNLKSMFLACQIFGRRMITQGEGGSIINISSASSGPPLSRVFTYSVSKAGVNNLTQNLAREWAPQKIRVNAIAPGFFPAQQNRKILTEDRIKAIFRHTPMARFGEPEELTGVVIWLASENASSFVTGAIIRVDGGYTAMTI
ncbi:SDR family oxidoreductase [bacterium]|nr:SDR family oxidoreductase [bacterium]RQV95561.1 MAG: SDR family oxidoreductase [bacterium]